MKRGVVGLKKALLFLSFLLIIALGSSCLYIVSVPIPIVEGTIEPVVLKLEGSPVAVSSFDFGTEQIPSLDEIIIEAKKRTQLNLPDNFVVTDLEVKARVVWTLEDPEPDDSISIDFYAFRERQTEGDFLNFFKNPDSIMEHRLFNDVVRPGENTFEIDSKHSGSLEMILEIINEGSSENIDWLALYDYEASSDSSVTIYLSGTVLVKRVVE
jgi:hypothetical protein